MIFLKLNKCTPINCHKCFVVPYESDGGFLIVISISRILLNAIHFTALTVVPEQLPPDTTSKPKITSLVLNYIFVGLTW